MTTMRVTSGAAQLIFDFMTWRNSTGFILWANPLHHQLLLC